MKVCIPVEEYRGLESPVYGHFGSAPAFALVDTETLAIEPLNNRNEHHQHGACKPLEAIGGRQVNAVIVGGIGPSAIRRLTQAGIDVFRFGGGTTVEAVQQFKAGALPVLTLEHACGSHGTGHDCHGH